jgi:hypothetical protein
VEGERQERGLDAVNIWHQSPTISEIYCAAVEAFAAAGRPHIVPEQQRVEHHLVLTEGLPAIDRIVREQDHPALA